MKLSLQELANAVGGTLYGADKTITNVSIDSRTVEPDGLYVAIRGERFDGHAFIEAAIQNGAVACLLEEQPKAEIPYILVKDTRTAFLALASYYRQQFKQLHLVGLTGSVGKTTTKEMIWSVLSEQFKTLKTEGNLNNEIGMPKTLLRLTNEDEAAVIEMGMSDFGEIDRMTRSCLPNLAVITNIGTSHIEFLGSRDGILQAKTEILHGMQVGSTLLLNGDDDKLWQYENPDYVLSYFAIDNPEAAVRATHIETKGAATEFDVEYPNGTQHVILPTVGKHNVYDALAAFSVGFALGLSGAQIAAGLSKYQTVGLRQKIETKHGITVIADCYNASLDSQKAAFQVLKAYPAKRKIAVLGDMLELGDFSEEAHKAVGAHAAKAHIDLLFCYGKEAKHIASGAEEKIETKTFLDKEALTQTLLTTLQKGDAVLFKASRGMKLEEVIESLYKEWDENE